jgi:hypothetical protein
LKQQQGVSVERRTAALLKPPWVLGTMEENSRVMVWAWLKGHGGQNGNNRGGMWEIWGQPCLKKMKGKGCSE